MSAEHTPTPSEEPKQPQPEDPRTYISFVRHQGQLKAAKTLRESTEPMFIEHPPLIDPATRNPRSKTARRPAGDVVPENTSVPPAIILREENRSLLEHRLQKSEKKLAELQGGQPGLNELLDLTIVTCIKPLLDRGFVTYQGARMQAEQEQGSLFFEMLFNTTFEQIRMITRIPDIIDLPAGLRARLEEKLAEYRQRAAKRSPESGKSHSEAYKIPLVTLLLHEGSLGRETMRQRMRKEWKELFAFDDHAFSEAWASIYSYCTE